MPPAPSTALPAPTRYVTWVLLILDRQVLSNCDRKGRCTEDPEPVTPVPASQTPCSPDLPPPPRDASHAVRQRPSTPSPERLHPSGSRPSSAPSPDTNTCSAPTDESASSRAPIAGHSDSAASWRSLTSSSFRDDGPVEPAGSQRPRPALHRDRVTRLPAARTRADRPRRRRGRRQREADGQNDVGVRRQRREALDEVPGPGPDRHPRDQLARYIRAQRRRDQVELLRSEVGRWVGGLSYCTRQPQRRRGIRRAATHPARDRDPLADRQAQRRPVPAPRAQRRECGGGEVLCPLTPGQIT